jgi:glycosyltransferase involved in cell wall biosynthesis
LNKKLIVISDTLLNKNKLFNSVGYELYAINHWFREIIVLGVLCQNSKIEKQLIEKPQNVTLIDYIPVNKPSSVLDFILQLKRSFFVGIFFIKYIRNADVIHVRGPGVPMFICILLSLFFKKKIWWFKYANNWNLNGKSKFWDFQKFLLNRFYWCKTTINGTWPNLPKHIFPFENPCIYSSVLKQADLAVFKDENYNKYSFIFIGRLTEQKGVRLGLDTLCRISKMDMVNNYEYHIVGEGELFEELESIGRNSPIKVIMHGSLSKNEVFDLLKGVSFLLLPSSSPEGFPKVVSEAMTMGCIPIVTKVSCIEQVLEDDQDAFLVDCEKEFLEINLCKTIKKATMLNQIDLHDMRLNASNKAKQLFTYARYSEKVKNLILN